MKIYHGDVHLAKLFLTELPEWLSEVTVTGFFDCCGNRLTTLKGSPKKVYRNVYCSVNQLVTLQGAPNDVGYNF